MNDTDTENVDVEDAAPALVVTKSADVTTNVAVGATITYTYTVENTGNQTLTNISLSDAHEGTGTGPTPSGENLTTDGGLFSGDSNDAAADGTWDSLAPGDIVTWTASYIVTQDDLNNQADNDLDNTVTATGSSPGNTNDVTDSATEEVDLEDQNPLLQVVKAADDTTDVVVGQTITYTYTVTNTGNVPISNISLTDNVTAGSGPDPVPGGEGGLIDNGAAGDSTDAAVDGTWDVLGPSDVITFTGTYVVTQSDVDTLQ